MRKTANMIVRLEKQAHAWAEFAPTVEFGGKTLDDLREEIDKLKSVSDETIKAKANGTAALTMMLIEKKAKSKGSNSTLPRVQITKRGLTTIWSTMTPGHIARIRGTQTIPNANSVFSCSRRLRKRINSGMRGPVTVESP